MEVAQDITIEAEKKETVNVSGSVALLEALIAEGVSTIFGYPGGAITIITTNYNTYWCAMSKAAYMPVRAMHVLRARLA
jgi:TPP-dependent indolepyruvate ferredoxin oxidoreductase alpha subunit